MGTINYGIFRLKTLKNNGALTNVSKHNSRADYNMPSLKYLDENHHNEFCLVKGTGSGSYLEDFKSTIEKNRIPTGEYDKATGEAIYKNPRIQKNSILGYDAVFTSSTEIPNCNYVEWIKDNLKFLASVFGKENVHSAYLHNDEGFDGKHTAPHLHVFVTPFWKNEKGNVILGAKHFTGSTAESTGIQKLRVLQDKYFNEVSSKYGLERGERGSKAKHKDPTIYKEEVTATRKKRQESIYNRLASLSPSQLLNEATTAIMKLQDVNLTMSKRLYFEGKMKMIQQLNPQLINNMKKLLMKEPAQVNKVLIEAKSKGMVPQNRTCIDNRTNNEKELTNAFELGVMVGALFSTDTSSQSSGQNNSDRTMYDFLMEVMGMSLEQAKEYMQKKKSGSSSDMEME